MVDPDLAAAFQQYFARTPGYRIDVTQASANWSVIDVRVTFLAGRSYCCAEPGCHFDLARFRQLAKGRGLALPDQLRVRFHGVVEDGVLLECHAKLGLPRRTSAYEYDEEFVADRG